MLFRRETLDGIVAGRITLQFRRWKAPAARAGGTQLTPIGLVAFDRVEPMAPDALTEEDARAAGYGDLAALKAELSGRDGDLYRIAVRPAGADPRPALREDADLSDAAIANLLGRTDRAFARAALGLIERFPGRRASDLAAELGLETAIFKPRVRALKAKGLTESLAVGYRLSPRGERVLRWLENPSPACGRGEP
jgi:hypothetical protein